MQEENHRRTEEFERLRITAEEVNAQLAARVEVLEPELERVKHSLQALTEEKEALENTLSTAQEVWMMLLSCAVSPVAILEGMMRLSTCYEGFWLFRTRSPRSTRYGWGYLFCCLPVACRFEVNDGSSARGEGVLSACLDDASA